MKTNAGSISAGLVVFNEEDRLESTLRSVRWCDEIIVVDKQSTDRTREIAESLRATLGSIVRAERIDALRSRNGVVSIAHLVERSGVETYRGFIHAFGHGRTDLRFFVSGPWPPYSFAA